MIFATIHVTSSQNLHLPDFMICEADGVNWSLTDDHAGRKERREKLHRKLGITTAVEVPRYHWTLDSDDKELGLDPNEHITWLLSILKDSSKVNELKKLNYDCWLAFCWTGNGTGGGPTISFNLVKKLMMLGVRLDIGFYSEDRM